MNYSPEALERIARRVDDIAKKGKLASAGLIAFSLIYSFLNQDQSLLNQALTIGAIPGGAGLTALSLNKLSKKWSDLNQVVEIHPAQMPLLQSDFGFYTEIIDRFDSSRELQFARRALKLVAPFEANKHHPYFIFDSLIKTSPIFLQFDVLVLEDENILVKGSPQLVEIESRVNYKWNLLHARADLLAVTTKVTVKKNLSLKNEGVKQPNKKGSQGPTFFLTFSDKKITSKEDMRQIPGNTLDKLSKGVLSIDPDTSTIFVQLPKTNLIPGTVKGDKVDVNWIGDYQVLFDTGETKKVFLYAGVSDRTGFIKSQWSHLFYHLE